MQVIRYMSNQTTKIMGINFDNLDPNRAKGYMPQGHFRIVVDRYTGQGYATMIGSYREPQTNKLMYVLDTGANGFTVEANDMFNARYYVAIKRIKLPNRLDMEA